MYKTLLGILIAVFVIAGAGCDSGGLTQGRTLVVDLLSVARALGRDESMTRQMEQARKQLNDQLTRIGNELEQKLREKETELSGSPDAKKEESKKQLEELTLQANLQLRQTRQLANRKALLFRDSLVEEFRNEVMTVAGRIARERVPRPYSPQTANCCGIPATSILPTRSSACCVRGKRKPTSSRKPAAPSKKRLRINPATREHDTARPLHPD